MTVEAVDKPALVTGAEKLGRLGAGARTRQLINSRPHAVQAMLSLADQAVFSGTSFVTAVIVGRATPPDVLGLYYLTLTIAYIAIGLQEAMIAAPYAILSARRTGRDLVEFTGSTWIHYFAWSGICVLGLVTAVAALQMSGGANVVNGLETLIVVLPLLLLRECIRRFAFARLRPAVALVIDAAVSSFQLGALLALWYLDRLTLVAIFVTMAVSCALPSFVWLFINRSSTIFVRQRVVPDWLAKWSMAQWSLASFLLSNTIPFVMPWIVGVAVGEAAAGIYGASATLIGVTNVLILGVSNFLMPKAAEALAERGVSGLKRVLLAMAALFVVLIGAFCVAILVTGDAIPVFVYGAEFKGTGSLVATLSANILVAALGMIAAQCMLVVGRQKHNFVIDICMFSTTMIAAAFLVPRFGPLGAAQASLGGVMVGTLLRTVKLQQVLRELRIMETPT